MIVQRLFARRDYVGLDEATAQNLKAERSRIAQDLQKKRKWNNTDLAQGGDIKTRNSNHSFYQSEAKASAEKARMRALENSTSTHIGKGANSLDHKIIKTAPVKPKKILGKGKTAGLIAAGTLAAAGLAYYGGKKLYDKNKKQ